MGIITINSVEEINNRYWVMGNTSIGAFKGCWMDEKEPVIGETYYFESDFCAIERGDIAFISDRNFHSKVDIIDNCAAFQGRCEVIVKSAEIDKDELIDGKLDEIICYAIRLDYDWCQDIEIINDDYTISEGDCISFTVKTDKIEIYPVEY